GEALERRQALEEVITELLHGHDWENMSDYEKSLQIHDIVFERAEYHYEAALANEGIGVNNDLDPAEVLETSTAHGALVNQRAICSGYAQAYQLLAQIVGLQSYYIEGSILVPVDVTEHAWNVVKLDDEWLVVDTTWDDTQTGKYTWMHLPSSFLEAN
ncbi:MAG TPA: hypothetical protein GXZ89_00945, partial [Fastidiosipila sp.]|nr:hypothetical protein [Fastidiosipila sp.]